MEKRKNRKKMQIRIEDEERPKIKSKLIGEVQGER